MLWYMSYVNGARLENASSMFLVDPQQIPERKLLRSGVDLLPPALITRRIVQPLRTVSAKMDIIRIMNDIAFSIMNALKAHGCIVDPKSAQTTTTSNPPLISTEDMFNYRFSVFAQVQRPHFVPYKALVRQSSTFQEASAAPKLIVKAIRTMEELARNCAPLLRQSNAPSPFFTRATESADHWISALQTLSQLLGADGQTAETKRPSIELCFPFHPALPCLRIV